MQVTGGGVGGGGEVRRFGEWRRRKRTGRNRTKENGEEKRKYGDRGGRRK